MVATTKTESRYIVKFSENWNGKLNNHSFSTIRLENHTKYKKNNIYVIVLFDVKSKNFIEIGKAKLTASSSFTLGMLSDTMSYIDANMTATNLKVMLTRMYSKKVNDVLSCRFNMLVFQFIKKV